MEPNWRWVGREAYVWAAVDADSGGPLAPDASYLGPSLNAYLYPRKALWMCEDKPAGLVGGGPLYPWALQMLGLQYVRGGLAQEAPLRGSSSTLKRESPYSITN